MAKEVITVDGEDRLVREDTAKSYRGVIWALICIAAFGIIAAIMFFGSALLSGTDNTPNQTPSQIEQKRQ